MKARFPFRVRIMRQFSKCFKPYKMKVFLQFLISIGTSCLVNGYKPTKVIANYHLQSLTLSDLFDDDIEVPDFSSEECARAWLEDLPCEMPDNETELVISTEEKNMEERNKREAEFCDYNEADNVTHFLRDILAYFGLTNIVIFESISGNQMTTRRQALVLSNSYFKWQIVDYATPTEKLPTNESLFVILLDSNKNVTKLLTKLQEAGTYNRDSVWLIQTEPEVNNLEASLENMELRIDEQLFTFYQTWNGSFHVQELYRVQPNSEPVQNDLGSWSPITGMSLTDVSIWERRKNLTGLFFTAATVEYVPFAYVAKDKNNQNQFSGIVVSIWEELGRALSFESQILLTKDGAFGSLMDDGKSFNGIIGMIQRGEADIAIQSLSLYKQRTDNFEYLVPFTDEENALFYKMSSLGDGSLVFIKPFHTYTWICIFLVLVICCCSFYLAQNLTDQNTSFSLSCMVIAHGILSQGSPHEPDMLSSRIVYIFLFITSVLTTFSYSASLTSMLAVKTTNVPFHDQQSLLSHSDHKVAIVKGTSVVDFYKHGSELEQTIFDEKVTVVDTFEEGLQLLQDQPLWTFYWPKVSLKVSLDSSCDLKHIPKFTVAAPQSFYVNPDWPYKKIFNHQISKMHENGQLEKIKQQWSPESPKDCSTIQSETLGLEKVYSIFVFLASVISLSSIIALIEMIVHWTKQIKY